MINRLTKEYLEEVQLLGVELNSNFLNLYDYVSLNMNVNETYLYMVNDKVAGFIHVQNLFDEVDIVNLVINKKYRRLGYASQLLNFIINRNLSKKILLEVNSKNTKAINLYKKFGFEIVNTRKKYYNEDDALVMERK